MRLVKLILILAALGTVFAGCSIRKMVTNGAAGALSGAENLVFSGDEDPELVGDALPFALKMYESLLEKTPHHIPLLVTTGKTFVMYSFGFVQTPADQMPEDRLSERRCELRRAKKLYLRARGYLLSALNEQHPGFTRLMEKGAVDSALALTGAADTTALYWAAMAWMGALIADKQDMDLVITMPRAVALITRVGQIAPQFGEGAVDEFFLSYYGGLPESMGGSEKRAREHFARAVGLSKGKKAGPYVSLAAGVCLRKQDIREFRELLGKALAVDVSQRDKYRLTNVIFQQKARWYLENEGNFFVSTDTLSVDSLEMK